MLSLLFSIVALLLGPLIYKRVSKSEVLSEVIDGFIFVSISALVLQHALPSLEGEHGALMIAALMLGFLGPNIIESKLHHLGQNVHTGVLMLGVFGLAIHGLLDGAALVDAAEQFADSASMSFSERHIDSLPLAIILHRLPVGLTIWFLIRPHFGRVYALLALGLLCLMTTIGYFGAELLAHSLHELEWLEFIQSIAAGAILHVVVFRFHLDDEHSHAEKSCCGSDKPSGAYINTPFRMRAEGLGNLLGFHLLGVMYFWNSASKVCEGHCHDHEVWERFMHLFAISAPALLLAYVVGGLMYAFTPPNSVKWLSKGGASTQLSKGLFVGLPLPICSCGVLPIYESLCRRGVPPAAAIAFLLATPELGIDALLLSFPLLGLEMTLLRLGAVIAFTVIVVSLVVRITGNEPFQTHDDLENESLSLVEKFRKGVYFGSISLVQNTGAWILVGLFVAAILSPLLSAEVFSLSPVLEVIVFSVIGAFLYVCAAGSTPLIAILLAGGLSPGAAISFLLTGPATNISTFGVIGSMYGKKTALLFGIVAASTAVLIGIVVNVTFGSSIEIVDLQPLEHEHVSLSAKAAMFALTLLFLFSIVRDGARNFFAQVVGKITHSH